MIVDDLLLGPLQDNGGLADARLAVDSPDRPRQQSAGARGRQLLNTRVWKAPDIGAVGFSTDHRRWLRSDS
jgi:hypothetical protein